MDGDLEERGSEKFLAYSRVIGEMINILNPWDVDDLSSDEQEKLVMRLRDVYDTLVDQNFVLLF